MRNWLLRAFLIWVSFVNVAAASTRTLDLPTFLALVAVHHPSLAIAAADAKKMQLQAIRVGTLPDPELAVSREDLPFGKRNAPGPNADMGPDMGSTGGASVENDTSPFWKFVLTQSFPWPGTLGSEQQAKAAQSEGARKALALEQLLRRLEATDLFIELVSLQAALQVHQASLENFDAVLKSAEARIRHGIGSHHELIAAQSNRAVHALNLAALQADLENRREHLALIAGFNPAENISIVTDWPEESQLLIEGPDLTREALLLRAEAQALTLTNERLRTRPRLTTSIMMMREDSGMKSFGLMAGISLPIFSWTQHQSLTQEEETNSGLRDRETSWHERQRDLALRQNTRQTNVLRSSLRTLSQEIVPGKKQHLATIIAEYSQGRVAFGEVNTALEQVLQFKLAETRARQDLGLSLTTRSRILAGVFLDFIDQSTPKVQVQDMENSMAEPQMSKSPAKVLLPKARARDSLEEQGSGTPDTDRETSPTPGRMGGM